ncbi:hypothetical protein ABI59_22895 [Acidobacteria bacterium Mor1]|nr:hypothetical protein ABI59_22895 [Acidobacteria bacterium Mor1]
MQSDISRLAGLALAALGLLFSTAALAEGQSFESSGFTFLTAASDQAYLGVRVSEETGHAEGGARVDDVIPDSPAAVAGLQKGDVIVSFAGEVVRGPLALTQRIHAREVGDRVDLRIVRDGAEQTLVAELGERQGPETYFFGTGLGEGQFDFDVKWIEQLGNQSGDLAETYREMAERFAANHQEIGKEMAQRWSFQFDNLTGKLAQTYEQVEPKDLHDGASRLYFRVLHGNIEARLGLELVDTTPELRRHLGGREEAGLLVSRVEDEGPAAEAGLQVGDLLVAAAGASLGDRTDLNRAFAAEEVESVELELIRDGSSRTVQLSVPEPAGGPPKWPTLRGNSKI